MLKLLKKWPEQKEAQLYGRDYKGNEWTRPNKIRQKGQQPTQEAFLDIGFSSPIANAFLACFFFQSLLGQTILLAAHCPAVAVMREIAVGH